MTKKRCIVRQVAVLTLSTAVALSALACAEKKKPPKRTRPLIGFSMDSLVAERWTRDRDVFMATAKFFGDDVILQIADEDPKTQESQIQYLIDQDVDSLVVVATDTSSLGRIVVEAKRRGIPVLSYERLVLNANTDLYLAFDYATVGKLQAQTVLDRMKRGRIALIDGVRSDPTAETIRSGWMSVLGPAVASKAVTIAGELKPAVFGSEEAYRFTDALCSSGEGIDAVIAASDLFAEAAIRALSVHRLAGKVLVAGVDADLAACQRIAEGTQFLTIYKPIGEIAFKGAELANYLARSERVSVHRAISDGSYRVPFFMLDPVLVTCDNLKTTVIKDGFHLEEDVYRNVIGKR
jgi:D-xylose transport system substrate-binding protein